MSDSERIKSVLDYLKLTVAKLARELGYVNATKIYNVTQGLNGISVELAKDITEKYREISFEWLKDGKGSMIESHFDLPEKEKNGQKQSKSITEDITMTREVFNVIKNLSETVISQQKIIESEFQSLKSILNKGTLIKERDADCTAPG